MARRSQALAFALAADFTCFLKSRTLVTALSVMSATDLNEPFTPESPADYTSIVGVRRAPHQDPPAFAAAFISFLYERTLASDSSSTMSATER